MNFHHHHSNAHHFNNDGVIDIKTYMNPQKVTPFLFKIIGVLTLLSILSNLAFYLLPALPLRQTLVLQFGLNEEHNFPTVYSSLGLFYCSVLFGFISSLEVDSKRSNSFYWKGLSVVFAYLGLDELLALHEEFTKPLNKLGIDGIFHYAWVVPALFVLIIFLITFYKFFLRLPNFLKRFISSAIALWVGGAIFVEILGGYYIYLQGEETLTYALITHVEEVMEMLGVVVLIHGLLLYLEQIGIHQINLSFNLGQSQVADPNLNSLPKQNL